MQTFSLDMIYCCSKGFANIFWEIRFVFSGGGVEENESSVVAFGLSIAQTGMGS